MNLRFNLDRILSYANLTNKSEPHCNHICLLDLHPLFLSISVRLNMRKFYRLWLYVETLSFPVKRGYAREKVRREGLNLYKAASTAGRSVRESAAVPARNRNAYFSGGSSNRWQLSPRLRCFHHNWSNASRISLAAA